MSDEPTLEDRVADIERRLEASERRHAQTIEAMSGELKLAHERFNQRQDTLAKELCERMDAIAASRELPGE